MKKKKIIAIVVPIVLILLIVGIILAIVLPNCNGGEDTHTHTDVYTSVSDTQHRHTCSTCSDLNVLENHVFGSDEKSCTLCDFVKPDPHTHTDKYESVSGTQHRHTCSTCSDLNVIEDHVLNEDETACKLCEYVKPHEHVYTYSEKTPLTHKRTCSGCEEVDVTEAHVYDNAEDTTCICGYVRELPQPSDTPSTVAITTDKNILNPGDEFTISVTVHADMPNCIWHSVSLMIRPFTEDGKPDMNAGSYFELVSKTNNLDTKNFLDTSNVDLTQSANYGLKVSVSLTTRYVTEEVSAANDIIVSFTLKVKDDAPAIPVLYFDVYRTSTTFVMYRNTETKKQIRHTTEDKLYEGNTLVSEEGGFITITKVPLAILPKED